MSMRSLLCNLTTESVSRSRSLAHSDQTRRSHNGGGGLVVLVIHTVEKSDMVEMGAVYIRTASAKFVPAYYNRLSEDAVFPGHSADLEDHESQLPL